MAERSLAVARRCIEHLRSELSGMVLEGVHSVFVSGSYVRGDWLDGRSDLDIGLVTDCRWERGFADVRRVVSDVVGEDGFDSHEEGGVDWNLIDAALLPRTTQQAIDSPYPYFSVFRFDLDAHCDILWGDDFRAPLRRCRRPMESPIVSCGSGRDASRSSRTPRWVASARCTRRTRRPSCCSSSTAS